MPPQPTATTAAAAGSVSSGTSGPTGPAAQSWTEPRPAVSASLLDAVADLRRDVGLTRFPLPLAGVDTAEARRRQLLDQLDDHLLPRLRELSAPAVVVVAGSTGAGKSTLVNSVLGTEVSAAGVLRPTTRRPVLAHHPDDGVLLAAHPLVPMVDVVAHPVVPRGIALVDAPDLDSLLATNRSTAHRLLEAADLWVFVTTPARYGDALPWDVLDKATTRGTSMAMVLNRVPADALVTVRGDLMARLRDRGMAAVPLFLVPDAGPHEGLLDADVVAPILRWLTMVAGPDRARSVIARTQRGALAALQPWVDELAEAVQGQVDARAALEALVDGAVAAPRDAAAASARAGSLANGPVRSRWTELTGEGGALSGRLTSRRRAEQRAGALREVLREVEQAATIAFAGATLAGAAALTEALEATDLPGAEGVLAAVRAARSEASVPTPQAGGIAGSDPSRAKASAAQWVGEVRAIVHGAVACTDKGRSRPWGRLVSSAGEDGAVALVAAAAAGLGAPRTVLATVVGADGAAQAVARAAEDLAARAGAHAESGASAASSFLGGDELAADAASLLRLRLAVLKGLR